jgi:tellurite resistance protein TerB
VVIDALLLVSDPSLSPDLLAISERVAVADETLHSHEVLAIKLLSSAPEYERECDL